MRVLLGLLGVITLAAFAFLDAQREVSQVVDELDVSRYMGRWYAVSSIPTTFERGCVRETTAEYALLENGAIEVTNTCIDDEGDPIVARGRAWTPDASEPGKLKVSFVAIAGLWLFAGDYWILDLPPDYRYAVVGHPDRTYGWILSRTPTLDPGTLEAIFDLLEAQGYDRNDFRSLPQTP